MGLLAGVMGATGTGVWVLALTSCNQWVLPTALASVGATRYQALTLGTPLGALHFGPLECPQDAPRSASNGKHHLQLGMKDIVYEVH